MRSALLAFGVGLLLGTVLLVAGLIALRPHPAPRIVVFPQPTATPRAADCSLLYTRVQAAPPVWGPAWTCR